MYLKRIEIYGFKSFAQRSVLDFEYQKSGNITAVVGPNGSGKSNVADAIRWVTGEQSSKNLRSKKGDDVIFCGSAAKARSSYAEVSIILSGDQPVKLEINNKDYELVEVEVSRKLYRSGDSEYLINGKKVRLTDIQQLLASLGFGQSSYTVIGQGMVDRLLFFNAAERKVLFDEAAGVKQYEIKREQAIRKLESTDANLIRLTDILSELEPRVVNLRRLVKRAEGRKEVEAELAQVQQKYFGSLLAEYSEIIREAEVKKEELNKKIVQFDETIAKLEASASESLANPHTGERLELESKIAQITAERDKLIRETAYLKGQVESASTRMAQIERERLSLENEQRTISERIDLLKEKLSAEKKLLEEKLKNKVGFETKIKEASTELENLDKQLSSPAESKDLAKASELEAKISELESSKQEISGKLYSLRQEESYAKVRAEQAGRKVRQAKQQLDDLKARLAAEQKKANDLKREINQSKTELSSEHQNFDSLTKELTKLESKLHELASQIDAKNLATLEKEILDLNKARETIMELFEKSADTGKLRENFKTFAASLAKLFENFRKVTKAASMTERENLEAKLNEIRREVSTLSSSISELEIKIARNESELSSSKERIVELNERIETNEAELAGLEDEQVTAPDQSLINELNAQLARAGDELAKLAAEHKKYLGLVSEHQNAILKQKSVIQVRLGELNLNLHHAEMDCSRSENIIQNQEAELANSRNRVEEVSQILSSLAEEPKSGADPKLVAELAAKEKALDRQEEDLAKFRGGLTQVIHAEREFEQSRLSSERERRNILDEKNSVLAQISNLDLETAKTTIRLEDLNEEIRLASIEIETGVKHQHLDQMEKDVMKLKMENLRRKLETIGGVDPETEAEFVELETRATEMATQVTDLTKAKADLEKVIAELDSRIKNQFSEVFKSIATEFSRYFSMLFNGGSANLKLGEDEEGNFGIEISANPPGKRVQSLNALSGGERTLTSLALLFAILSVNPSPFCVLDEVDAALDESNTLRFVKILEDLAKRTQFIVISHNRDTMKVASSLYGVTMNDEHVSKLLSVKLTEALVSAKQ